MTWSIRGKITGRDVLEEGLCDACGHYAYGHPCNGWSRKWSIQFGRLVWLVRCRCKTPKYLDEEKP